MKKIFLSALLYVMLISMNYESSNATCLPGWSTYNGAVLNIFGCDYYIEVCFKCTPTNSKSVKLNGYSKVDQSCISSTTNEADIMNEIVNRITDANFIYSNLCIGSTPVPCDEYDAGEFYSIGVYRCWEKKWFDDYLWTVPCETGDDLCYYMIKFCFNFQTNEWERKMTQPPMISTYFECPTVFPPNPPKPGTSACFHLNTICD
ncbi:MAG: hypothetical protein NTW25_13810 [Candidatus Kapabacteria bacterium]|nr:hypothetical protein [Candidatus Kapabacteria bacterium]